jgi:hypothetical protein
MATVSRRTKVLALSLILVTLVALLGDGDWWLMALAGAGVYCLVNIAWPDTRE